MLANVCRGEDAAGLARKQRSAEAGAIEEVVQAMRAHPQVAGVQQYGCHALVNVCDGDDAAGRARRLRATRAGGRTVAVAAMQAHPDDGTMSTSVGSSFLSSYPNCDQVHSAIVRAAVTLLDSLTG